MGTNGEKKTNKKTFSRRCFWWFISDSSHLLKLIVPLISGLTQRINPTYPNKKTKEMPYNVGPPSVISWFITPITYSYYIYHKKSEMEVICTKLAKKLGPHSVLAK